MNSKGSSVLTDIRHFLQGRVFAETYEEAVERIEASVRDRGHEPVRLCRAWPCLIQHHKKTWWEYMIEVEGDGKCGAL